LLDCHVPECARNARTGGIGLTEGVPMRKATLWLRRWLIADVPAHIAACEFNCKSVSCPNEKFDHCQRRLALEKEIKEQESQTGVSFCTKKISPSRRKKKRDSHRTKRGKSSKGRHKNRKSAIKSRR
jgi:hypothetical protein